jgi:hypothetical protein
MHDLIEICADLPARSSHRAEYNCEFGVLGSLKNYYTVIYTGLIFF